MKLLLTGGAGFIGHHFIEHIIKNTDWEIVVLDKLSYAGDLNRVADITLFKEAVGRIRFVYHDLRAELNAHLAAEIGDPDYIVHLAAESHVDRSISNPLPFVDTNVRGTTNLLNFARSLDYLKAFINFSTDEVFGPAPSGVNYKEDDRFRPSNPYAATKVGQTAMGMAFFTTYGTPVINTFTMNNFGERQHPEKFIPLVVKKVMTNSKVTVHGTPGNIGSRYWIHARNTADAILYLLGNGIAGEAYNVVGEVELNNLELAQKIARILEIKLEYDFLDFHASRPGHDRRYALDGTKIAKLGWKQPVDFEYSLSKTVKWMATHPRWLSN